MTIAIHEIQLIGFGAFERATLESFFRMTEQRARRAPSGGTEAQTRSRGYVSAQQPGTAELVLIDGSDPQAVEQARAWPQRCVIVGGANHLPGALGHMPRPINMMALLKLLDDLMARRGAPDAPAPAGAPAPATAAPAAASPPASDSADGNAGAQILVVDDSDVALRFMARCLARYGLGVQLAHSGEEALQRVASGRFEFVFMDVNMPGIDGYQTCKLIKKRPYPAGRRAPKVVMLTSRGGMVDKMRGTLAGCDAYLTKPLQQDDLVRVIGNDFLSARAAPLVTRASSLGSA